MKRRRLGRSGPEISVIGVGTWAAGGDEWGGQDQKDSIDAIQQAIACGVNWVDTAPTYGLGFSEELVGRAIAQLHCRSNGVGVIVWSPLMRGLLAGHLTREAIAALPADDSRRTEVEFREPRLSSNLALVERVRGVARRHGRTPAQIAIAWTLRDPVVTGAIVGMRSAAHVEKIAVASTIELDADDLHELASLVDRRAR